MRSNGTTASGPASPIRARVGELTIPPSASRGMFIRPGAGVGAAGPLGTNFARSGSPPRMFATLPTIGMASPPRIRAARPPMLLIALMASTSLLNATAKPMTAAVAKINGLVANAMFSATTAAAIAPIVIAIRVNTSGLFCAQSANFCMYGITSSSTGKNAAPMPSLVSAMLFLKIAILPAAVSAFFATAPPNVPPSTSMTSSRVAPSLIIVAISGVNDRSALKLP